ncbi:glucosamine-phosphate N-acetyltransferase, partial [Phenoliferia sp. Uapishka_3]
MGTLFMERKFIRGCGTAGHLEDIVVGENQQGKGLGKIIINVLTELSETLGAYKVSTRNREESGARGACPDVLELMSPSITQTILDCDVKNEGFYVKCGYENKGYEMAKYAKKD